MPRQRPLRPPRRIGRRSSGAAGCRRPRSPSPSQKVRRAYSPIVIAGAVRVADFVLLSLVGIALYFGYVVPLSDFHWEYVAAIFGMTAAAVICFQAADIYEVQVFRGQLRQMTRMISSWAFVFLLFIGASFFAKLGGEVSRLWLAAFFFIGLAVLIAERLFLRSLVRGWARQGRLRPPHHHRRLRPERRKAGRGAQGPGRFGHRYPRRVRRPQRRPRARDLRRQPETRQGRRHRRIRPPHPRRPRAVRAADFGGDADSRNAEEIVGAAGRHPAFRPHQQAALPPPLLFLSRQGPDARRVRGADHRLGSGDEVAVRPCRRRASFCCWRRR